MRDEKTFDSLVRLISQKVTRVIKKEAEFGPYYILIFDNGLKLTARDGEYGDNAFEFVEEED